MIVSRKTLGSLLGKAVGIDADAHRRQVPDDLIDRTTRAVVPFDTFLEDDPTVKEWILEHVPTRDGTIAYITSFFPFTKWIYRYNTRWLTGDIIAGTTLGLVVVPQALSYALLANLSPEYGLYTSFTGASLYWLFGTSKDIAIGATAVVSLLVGKTGDRVSAELPEFNREQIAKTHAFLAGCVLLVFALLRLDWIIEFIPHVAIAAFVTSAAITITLSQVPTLLGIAGVNSKGPAYQVAIGVLKGLPRAKMDAAIGLTALLLLYSIKWFCEHMAKRKPLQSRLWTTLFSLRFTFTIVLYILISFLVNRNMPLEDAPFRILGNLPTGFSRAGAPTLDPKLMSALLPELPATVVILILEHIAIGKSFSRINNYTVVPSQEIMSIAATNMLGPFVGAYASTGSFGGTAILSKAGVRTPLAGIFNGFILILALYALTNILYFIPMASLAALIIHAVINVMESPSRVYKTCLISPPDMVIFFAGVFVAIFTSLENGIYVTVAMSITLLLLRLARSRGRLMGRLRVYHYPRGSNAGAVGGSHSKPSSETTIMTAPRSAFLPLDRHDASNPAVAVESPCAGVFIYRFSMGFNYLNQAQHVDHITQHIMRVTRRTTKTQYEHPGDAPWNEPQPPVNHSKQLSADDSDDAEQQTCKPTLRAVILDFAAVGGVLDSGAVEGLVDLRTQLDRWAAPDPVEWHFAHAGDRWTRRALAVAGFGYPGARQLERDGGRWEPLFVLSEKKREGSGPASASGITNNKPRTGDDKTLTDADGVEKSRTARRSSRLAPVYGINRPNFHIDLEAAVEACERSLARKDNRERGDSGQSSDASD
ncbi:hypothetical protein DL766_001862 [Monosporascus sp. MC13-8B]|uniref:SLC26A/SulP transporter domain-containing protein n=1 Tax=Monosporascus cannonballus TaxID=155416 RepID=A0ABY0HJS2_9PEZI|nr:hypothetical protein DL762_001793 [Monosporascus cannonballus]RYP36745.1 hypothetical protein DL766_001862 [Monosporascus sp. MC13-8B]